MKSLLIITFLLTFYSCLTKTKQAQSTLKVDNKNSFYQAFEQHFKYIDSVRKTTPDLIEGENLKIQQSINYFKKDILNLTDSIDYGGLYIVKSTDKKLCLISWDTRMGGTMIEFATMAIFQTSSGDTISKILFDTSESPIGNTLMHYDNLYSIQNADKTIYIAHGFGQGSTILQWQELRAFQILNKELINPNVFPEQKPNLFIEFDTQKLKREEIPMILLTDSGKTISLPILNEMESFSGKYQNLVFHNGIYKIK